MKKQEKIEVFPIVNGLYYHLKFTDYHPDVESN